MLEPTGPLPPEIYWRRRVFAIGALVVALAVVIWLVVTVTRGGGSPGATGAAASSTASSEAAASSAPSATTATSTTAATTSATESSEPAPAAAGQCADQSLAIKVSVAQPTYRVGEEPVFGIVITNISGEPCTRDMGSGLQRVSVRTLDGGRQLWASTDCYPDGEPDLRTLDRGEQAAFTVTWTGTTSQPECAGERVQVPSGAYHVVAQLGAVRSAPEPFNIAE
ncbi:MULTISPECIES: hypothetical protein [Nocardia]|uniref:hypothetical protein n=1 Tax=Nocardia TaxID=1817 RepID=UPI001895BCE2|nr:MULTISPECIES: hypothetical protein [Nocardia]MBF6349787.1 hypothetical protein [Nocardia flavorosea]